MVKVLLLKIDVVKLLAQQNNILCPIKGDLRKRIV